MSEDDKVFKFDFSLGTAMRIQQIFVKINLYKEYNDYLNFFHHLNILYDDISPIILSIDKKTGEIVETEQFKIMKRLKEETTEIMKTCYTKHQNGQTSFNINMQTIRKMNEYELYMKTICMVNHLYMTSVESDEDTGILGRKPKFRFAR